MTGVVVNGGCPGAQNPMRAVGEGPGQAVHLCLLMQPAGHAELNRDVRLAPGSNCLPFPFAALKDESYVPGEVLLTIEATAVATSRFHGQPEGVAFIKSCARQVVQNRCEFRSRLGTAA